MFSDKGLKTKDPPSVHILADRGRAGSIEFEIGCTSQQINNSCHRLADPLRARRLLRASLRGIPGSVPQPASRVQYRLPPRQGLLFQGKDADSEEIRWSAPPDWRATRQQAQLRSPVQMRKMGHDCGGTSIGHQMKSSGGAEAGRGNATPVEVRIRLRSKTFLS